MSTIGSTLQLVIVYDMITGGEAISQQQCELRDCESRWSMSPVVLKANLTNLRHIGAALAELEARAGFEPFGSAGRHRRSYTRMGATESLRPRSKSFRAPQAAGARRRQSWSAEAQRRQTRASAGATFGRVFTIAVCNLQLRPSGSHHHGRERSQPAPCS